MWLYHKWLVDLLIPIKLRSIHLIGKNDKELELLLVFTSKVTNIRDSNIDVAYIHNETHNLSTKISEINNKKTSCFWKLTITLPENSDLNNGHLILKFRTPHSELQNPEKTIKEVRDNSIADMNNKHHVTSDHYRVQFNKDNDALLYETISQKSEYRAKLEPVLEEQFKTFDELLALEPTNRFAHTHLIHLLTNVREEFSNKTNKVEERKNLNKEVLKSAFTLKENNRDMKNRFESLYRFYQMKGALLNILLTHEPRENINEFINDRDLITMNLEELADLFILTKVSITHENELKSVLKVFH